MRKILLTCMIVGLGLLGRSQERIINFHSDITVNADRSVHVVETIKVYATGNQISRGIFRDIPIVLRKDSGKKQFYKLIVNQVLKDGIEESYSNIGITDGRRLRIGEADVYLNNGEYEYTIDYTMSGQVRFFNEHDELYWNVTGNEWLFDIDQASAKVTLPDGAVIKQFNGYTGSYGEEEAGFTTVKLDDKSIKFITTKKLTSYQGLTLAVGWQKGIVPPPTDEELRAEMLEQYVGILYGGIGIIFLFIYLFWAWKKVGVDPEGGAIIPRFIAPKGYSPAACRYVMRMGFDNKSFAASLVSMAVKGFLKIDYTGEKYNLHKLTDEDTMLSKGERKIANNLFSEKNNSLEINEDNHDKISGAISALDKLLGAEFKKINFSKNGIWMLPAVLLAIAVSITMLVKVSYDEEIMVPLLLEMIVMLFITMGASAVFKIINSANGWRSFTPILWILIPFILLVILPIYIIVLQGVVTTAAMWVFVPYLLVFEVMIAMIVLFFYLIKAPTVMGRKVLDEIEGLKLFMEVAEKDRFNVLNPPEKTPQLFEKLLPYAIALGVENQWGDQFESIIARAIEQNEYRPTWYGGDMYAFNHVGRLSNNLGSSFSLTITAASISPQSSSSSGSGFGGGGFSGGGGGGGGGGGW